MGPAVLRVARLGEGRSLSPGANTRLGAPFGQFRGGTGDSLSFLLGCKTEMLCYTAREPEGVP